MAFSKDSVSLPHVPYDCYQCFKKQLNIDSLAEYVGRLCLENETLRNSNAGLVTSLVKLAGITTAEIQAQKDLQYVLPKPPVIPSKKEIKKMAAKSSKRQKDQPPATQKRKVIAKAAASVAKKPKLAGQQCLLCGYFTTTRNMAKHYGSCHKGYQHYAKGKVYFNTNTKLDSCPAAHLRTAAELVGADGVCRKWLGKKKAKTSAKHTATTQKQLTTQKPPARRCQAPSVASSYRTLHLY